MGTFATIEPDPAELDDFAARPHSAGSTIRTFIGLHLRRIGGWIAVSDLIELCGLAGCSAGGLRSALSRLKAKGILQADARDNVAGYTLSAPAERMLARGDRRIFSYQTVTADEGWLIVVFSIPDELRHLRHQLRTQLTWLGCGTIAPGTWIGPGHLLDEAIAVLTQYGLRDYVTVLHADQVLPPGELPSAAQRWWDLAGLDQRYAEFLAAHDEDERRWDRTAATAFTEHLRLVDDWRAIPYLDPGLPTELTPPGWRGHEGVALFARLQDLWAGPATGYVDTVVGAHMNHSGTYSPSTTSTSTTSTSTTSTESGGD